MIKIWHEATKDRQTIDVYNQIYQEQGILHHDSLYLWAIERLKPVAGRTIMDIATGEGRLPVLAKKYKLKAFGTDFAHAGLRKGCAEDPRISWFTADGELLPIRDHCMDYVTHIGSLEHYLDPVKGAQEITRMLKPGGKACILLPNAFGLFGNIQYVAKTGDVFDDGQPLQRVATRREWERLLTSAGMRILHVYPYHEVMFPRTRDEFFYLLKRPQKIIRYLITKFVPINLANHLVFLCEYV